MKNKKGISPVIAVIIIIAVTIAIAVAVAGWMMGLWGAYTAVEALTIMPDSKINGTDLILHIKNTGSASAVIYKVEIGGLGSTTADITVDIGVDTTTTLTNVASGAIPGASYTVTIYTKSGKMYQAVVIAS